MSFLLVALILAALLFWLAPLLRRIADRFSGIERSQRTSVLITSLVLRGTAVALIALLWLGITEFRQTVPATTKARVDVLLDLSESLVHEDGPEVGTYLREAERLTGEIVDGLGVPAEVHRRVFAQGSRTMDSFNGAASTLSDIGGSSTDLSAVVAETLATGAGSPAQAIVLMTDGLTTRQGATDDAQITQVLQLLAGGSVPVLVVPQEGQPAYRLANPNDPRFIIGDDQSLSLLSQGDLEEPLIATPIDLAIKPQDAQRVTYLGALQGDRVQDLFRFFCLDGDPAGTAAIIIDEMVDTLSCTPLILDQEGDGSFIQMTVKLDNDPDPVPESRFAQPRLPDVVQSRMVPTMATPRVLWLDGGAAPIVLIETIFEELKWEIERLVPSDLPRRTGVDATDPLDLFDYDLILMTDFAPGEMGDGITQQAILGEIEDFVQRGGGLFIAGGDETYGVKGYAATPVARVLPVNVEPKGSSGDPKLLAVGVLDVSASLFYEDETMDRAVRYIVESFAPLSEGSLVRIFGFSDEVHELVPLDKFQGVEELENQIRESLALLAEEFERRRLLGLQPEGIDIYDALFETRRSMVMAEEAGFELPDERRVLIVADGADPDTGAYLSWKVDEDGIFQRDTAPALAARLNSEDDFIINGIAMAYGETSLPDIYDILNSRDPTLRQRAGIASEGFNNLFAVAEAGGGVAYLDRFQIPIGQLARRMVSYKDELIEDPQFNVRHRFLNDLPAQEMGLGSVSGYSVLAARDEARFIIGQQDYQPEQGRPLDLALWTDWVLKREPESSTEGFIERAAVGGRVSALGTSLRDGGEDGTLTSNLIFQVALARAFAWATRTSPRDTVDLSLTRDDRNQILLALNHRSIDPFAPTAFTVELYGYAEPEADAAGIGEADQQRPRGELVATFDLIGSETRWTGTLGSIRDLPEAFEIVVRGEGTDRQGRSRSFEKSGVVYPAYLHRATEPLAMDTGANMDALKAIAKASGGVVLDPTNLLVPSSLVQLDQSGTRERIWDLTWVIVFLLVLALVADYLIREYLSEAEA